MLRVQSRSGEFSGKLSRTSMPRRAKLHCSLIPLQLPVSQQDLATPQQYSTLCCVQQQSFSLLSIPWSACLSQP